VKQHLKGGSLSKKNALAKAVRSMASKMSISSSDGKLWIMREGGMLEILNTVERIKEVLLMLYEGMGHRALGSVYTVFIQRFWVPGASKLISRHILACRSCQEFNKPNPMKSPGFCVNPTDVFSLCSIDFAGPFPPDSQTGCRYVYWPWSGYPVG